MEEKSMSLSPYVEYVYSYPTAGGLVVNYQIRFVDKKEINIMFSSSKEIKEISKEVSNAIENYCKSQGWSPPSLEEWEKSVENYMTKNSQV